jgi:MATE family multidrug resistance protein
MNSTVERQKSLFDFVIAKQVILLALPIVFGQLGFIFMGFFDLLMLGQVGTDEVAAVGIANAIFFLFFMFAQGVLMSISPLVAIACGSNRKWKSVLILKAGNKIALVLGLLLASVYVLFYIYFSGLGQTKEVTKLGADYLLIVSVSALPTLLFMANKNYLDGLGRTRPASLITMLALLLNIVLNQWFIFGGMGVEPMGIQGAAWATTLVRFAMALSLLLYIKLDGSTLHYKKEAKGRKSRGRYIRKIRVMGIPIGLQFFFEVAAFSFAAVMAGWIGSMQQASHNIALMLASITYMGATGLSAAGGILVGNAYGATQKNQIAKIGKVLFVIVSLYMALCACLFLFGRDFLAYRFSTDPDVIQTTSILLVFAAFFQFSDGLQSAGMGLLRGVKDVKIPSLIAFISYWIVGIPVSYFLAFNLQMGIKGVWIGFIAGLSLAAVLIVFRFFKKAKSLHYTKDNVTTV